MRHRTAVLSLLAVLAPAACSSSGSPRAGTTPTLPKVTGSPTIVAGERFSAELTSKGEVLTWGHNATGELGDGSATNRPTPVRVRGLPAGERVVSIAAGSNHVLALLADGTVWAWGHNRSGQLGDGSKDDRPSPVPVKSLHDVRAVAAGDAFSVALEADGTVLAWGNNASGQLGDGNAPIDHARPAAVHGLGAGSGVVEIAAGKSYAIVRKADGSVLAWGNGTSGQLGDGANDKRSAPTPVAGLGAGAPVVAIAAGGSFSLALERDGTVLAWGNNKSGELGDAHRPTDRNRPGAVKGLAAHGGAQAIAAGSSFAAALMRDGTVMTWGRNKVGELGNGTYDDASLPVAVSGTGGRTRVVAIAAGAFHMLALEQHDQVLAWGDNSSGQLGDGSAPANHASPVVVRALSGT